MNDPDRIFWEQWDRWRVDAASAPFTAYAVALALFGVAFLGRLLLDQVLPGRLPFVTFFPAVLLSAFFAGTVPSLFVLVASGVIGALWLAAGASPVLERLLSFGLFLVTGGAPIALLRIIDHAVARIRRQEQKLALINDELKHRLKNLFAVTDSVFRQSLKSGASAEELRHAVSERLQALAAAQDLVSPTAQGTPVEGLVDAVVLPLAPHPSRLLRHGPRALLSAEQTTTVALMLHELATNAIKHGAWRGETGTVAFTWKFVRDGGEQHRLAIDWVEQGGPAVVPPRRAGFGTTLLKARLTGTQVALDLKPEGVNCRIEMTAAPMPPADEAPLSRSALSPI